MKKFTESFSNNNKKFKVSLDLHGVIDAMPEFFSFLTNCLINSDCEIHIVTGGTSDKDIQLLKDYNIRYTHFFSITDYHREKGTPTHGINPKYGFPQISDLEWDKTKGDYCKKHNIDLHIDDTLAYNNYFTTPFARLWSHSGQIKDKDEKHMP